MNQYRFHFLLLILLSLVSIALSLFQVNTVQGLIDAVLAGSRTRTGTAFISFSAAGLAIMLRNGLFESLAGRLEARTGCAIRNRLLRHILKIRLDRLETISAGELLSRYDGDINKISVFFRSGTLTLLVNPLLSICGFLYLFHYSPLLSLGVFFPVPFFAIMLNSFSMRAGRIYEKGEAFNPSMLRFPATLSMEQKPFLPIRWLMLCFRKWTGFFMLFWAIRSAM